MCLGQEEDYFVMLQWNREKPLQESNTEQMKRNDPSLKSKLVTNTSVGLNP